VAVITVGSTAENRDIGLAAATQINKAAAADGDGTLSEAQIYVATELSGLEIATFIDEGSNNLSTRANETIAGSHAAGYHEIALDNMAVETGDFIGEYHSGGTLDADNTGGSGMWYKTGDNIPADSVGFSSFSGWVISLKGIGATVAAGVGIPIAMYHYKQMQENN